jgi:hypothetical protein
MNNIDDTSDPQSTTIALGGAEVTLTHNDALAIEQALLAYLASAVATLVRENSWRVVRIASERIRRRR